jgi:hypothetical protein
MNDEAQLLKVNSFTVVVVVALTIVALGVSIYQMVNVGSQLSQGQKLDMQPSFTFKMETPKDVENFQNQIDSGAMLNQWMALVTLEAYATESRHRQANVLLLTRVWLRLLSMTAGLILCTAGSLFILGRLKEPDFTASSTGGPNGFGLNLSSASPGLVFAVLGSILIVIPLLSNPPVDLKDSRAFMGNQNEVIPGVSQ